MTIFSPRSAFSLQTRHYLTRQVLFFFHQRNKRTRFPPALSLTCVCDRGRWTYLRLSARMLRWTRWIVYPSAGLWGFGARVEVCVDDEFSYVNGLASWSYHVTHLRNWRLNTFNGRTENSSRGNTTYFRNNMVLLNSSSGWDRSFVQYVLGKFIKSFTKRWPETEMLESFSQKWKINSEVFYSCLGTFRPNRHSNIRLLFCIQKTEENRTKLFNRIENIF